MPGVVAGRLPLFAPGEDVNTPRIRLSLATPSVSDDLPWLAAALAPEWAIEDLRVHLERGEGVLIGRRDGRPIGVALALPDVPTAGAACVPLIAVAPAERFRGLGGEAGLALERRVHERWGSRVVFAPVPAGRGLAVYFWLRLGYRPLTAAEAPWPPAGLNGKARPGIWMARDPSDRPPSPREAV